MKRIGSTVEDGEYLHLVSLSAYEFSVLNQVLEERDLSDEINVIRQWGKEFRKEIERLGLPSHLSNKIIRSLHWQYDLYKHDGKLLNFAEWRELMCSTDWMHSPANGVRNLGNTGYRNLIDALKRSL